MYKRLRTYSIGTLGIIVLTIVAYHSGSWFAASQRNKAQTEFYQRRQELTNAYLRSRNLKVGDKVPAHDLEDLNFRRTGLESVLKDKSLLLFIDPTCYSCEEELSMLSAIADTGELWQRLIIISAGNPRHLLDIRESYQLKCEILYDHNRVFSGMLAVESYPCNLFVSKDRTIEKIAMGGLTRDEVDSFLRSEM